MSHHAITKPTPVRWAQWYIPEMSGAVLLAGLGATLSGPLALAGLVPVAAIGVQEAHRITVNAWARHQSRREAARARQADETEAAESQADES